MFPKHLQCAFWIVMWIERPKFPTFLVPGGHSLVGRFMTLRKLWMKPYPSERPVAALSPAHLAVFDYR